MKYIKNILWILPFALLFAAGCAGEGGKYLGPAGSAELGSEAQPQVEPAVQPGAEGTLTPAPPPPLPPPAGAATVTLHSALPMATARPPVSTSGPPEWIDVSVASHTCAVGGDHSLWCWGDNPRGELGTGRCNSSGVPTPVRVGADTNWSRVTAGDMHTCAIRTDGTLWCWGNNQYGQMGTGDTSGDVWCANPNPRQTAPADRNDWTEVSAGSSHTCGIAGGRLYCWGDNGSHQLGISPGSDISQVTSPTEVEPGTKWVSVSAGMTHTCAISVDNTLWCWGSNDKLQIGAVSGAGDSVSAPLQMSGGHYIFVDAGSQYTCAVTGDRKMMCGGKMGMIRPFPTQAWDDGNWMFVGTDAAFACGLRTDSTLWCWNDHFGAKIGGAEWKSVAFGAGTTCAIKNNGTLWCWGRNQFGRVGDGTTTDRLLPVPISRP